MTLTLLGHVATKKNGKAAFNGRVVQTRAKKADLDSLILQARQQWGGRPPLQKAKIQALFFVRDGRGDLDGKYTTLQDVLVKAGVIRNDSIARLPGFKADAIIDPHERVIVDCAEVI